LQVFLQENPAPTADQVRQAIAGHLCRCTGYQHIVEATLRAAAQLRGEPA
jgi:aerobic carbon-monoxide dehydrogenase small subunit